MWALLHWFSYVPIFVIDIVWTACWIFNFACVMHGFLIFVFCVMAIFFRMKILHIMLYKARGIIRQCGWIMRRWTLPLLSSLKVVWIESSPKWGLRSTLEYLFLRKIRWCVAIMTGVSFIFMSVVFYMFDVYFDGVKHFKDRFFLVTPLNEEAHTQICSITLDLPYKCSGIFSKLWRQYQLFVRLHVLCL